ncbi:MAG: hypothetical protein HUN04_14390 [Desulfobacter sp.]|nr:MAG: hypothetical protein HUN04_14390 [Desulfobacter sp.]
MMETAIDKKKWKRHAMAFAIRSHNHLWGKNNEDPLVFLFRKGLSHDFSRQMYLGWNKFGQERPYENWGIQREGKFMIPPGIVFPYIIDKDLKALFVIPMEKTESSFSFPGNPDQPIILGPPDNRIIEVEDIIQGLCRLQENPGTACVKITV